MPVLALFVITILFARKLSYDQYGIFQSMWIYINVLNVVLSLGVPTLILSTDIDQLKEFFLRNRLKIITIFSLWILVSFFIFYFNSPGINGISKSFLMVFILLQTINAIFESLYIKKDQIYLYILSNFFYAILFLLVHLYFYFQEYSLKYLIITMVMISLIKCLFIFFLHTENSAIQKPIYSSTFYKQWLFVSLNDIIGIFGKWLDKIFLLFFITTSEFAIYYNGSIEIPFLGMLIGSVGSIMLAQISRNIANRQSAKEIFRESFKILSLISFPLFFFFLISHNEIFYLFFENKYDPSIPVFLVYILLIPIRINHYGVILQCYGKTRHILYGTILDIIIALILMWFLYPLFGTSGVAAAIVISTYIQVIYYLIHSAKTLNSSIRSLIPSTYIIRIASFIFLGYAFLYFLKKFIPTNSFLIISIVITALIILLSVLKQLQLFRNQ